MTNADRIAALLAEFPVVLAPMEDVTNAAYRKICRTLGAHICVTEFIGAELIVAGSKRAKRKALLPPGDRPTAIQIYGPDADLLMTAATIAMQSEPTFIDINCGCWVPRVVGRGAGAAWLREPAQMVEMARRIVEAVELPVTVKTRIGYGPESHMPIVDLARRLEDVGVAGLTIHCRTAEMGHQGDADWSWARRAREVVKIPVTVNGDIRTAQDVRRALDETGCAAVMVGRAAIDHPWIFREARAMLSGQPIVPPTYDERISVYMTMMLANVEQKGETNGVAMTRRHVHLLGPRTAELKSPMFRAKTIQEVCAVLMGAGQTRSIRPSA